MSSDEHGGKTPNVHASCQHTRPFVVLKTQIKEKIN